MPPKHVAEPRETAAAHIDHPKRVGARGYGRVRARRELDNHDYVREIKITATGTFRIHPRVSGYAFRVRVRDRDGASCRPGYCELPRQDFMCLGRDVHLGLGLGMRDERRCCRASLSSHTGLSELARVLENGCSVKVLNARPETRGSLSNAAVVVI